MTGSLAGIKLLEVMSRLNTENKQNKKKVMIVMLFLLAVLLVGIILTHRYSVHHETIKETMKDAVLHDRNQIRLPGGIMADPSLISGFIF